MQVEIWSDVVCPWCYLGKRRFEKAVADFSGGDEIEVVHRAFQLDPGAPVGSTVETTESLRTKYGMSAEQVEQAQRSMEQRAAAEGLEYHFDGQRTGNTRDAHRLLRFAATRGVQDALLDGMYRAYFTEHGSLFDAESLTAVGVAAGLDADELQAVLAGDDFAAEVAADIDQAREYGISGVPFFVIDRRLGVSGAQPVEVFAQALQQAAR